MNLRRDRFEKVAAKRVQDILKKLSLLGNCSNRNNYEYNEEDIKLMFKSMNAQLKKTEMKFQNNLEKSDKSNFKF